MCLAVSYETCKVWCRLREPDHLASKSCEQTMQGKWWCAFQLVKKQCNTLGEQPTSSVAEIMLLRMRLGK